MELISQSFKALKPKAKKALSIKALDNIVFTIKSKLMDNTDRNEKFYYKVARNLSESQIYDLIDRSQNANSPVRYFVAAAAREMKIKEAV